MVLMATIVAKVDESLEIQERISSTAALPAGLFMEDMQMTPVQESLQNIRFLLVLLNPVGRITFLYMSPPYSV